MNRIVIAGQRKDTERPYWSYVMWLAVPAGLEAYHANPNFVSAYKAATTEELDALRAGQFVEIVGEVGAPTKDAALDSIQGDLQKLWEKEQSNLNNDVTFLKYGTIWDGKEWTQPKV